MLRRLSTRRSTAPDETGLALVAVGGYGRVRAGAAQRPRRGAGPRRRRVVDPALVKKVAEQVWYPLWDAGADIDHSVRALVDVTGAAKQDPRVALGLLDARHVAGDPSVTLRLRADLLAHWRRDARTPAPGAPRDRGPARVQAGRARARLRARTSRSPSAGCATPPCSRRSSPPGSSTSPHTDLERSRLQLLDLRDALHEVTGRATDRIAPELWPDLADGARPARAARRRSGRCVRSAGASPT